MMKISRLLLVIGLLFAGAVNAQVYNRFGPANGILKGDTSTYVTTPAASLDVRGLWTGTCDNTTFLRGDGTCVVPAGTGVTSVGLTVPSGLSVTGSPVTSSGTLAISTTLNGVVHGTGSGFTTGTVTVPEGGTGAVTLSGVLKGNTTSPVSSATSADVRGLWTGTCDNTTFLRGDGTCAAGAGGTGGNPTATIGLTAVNGVAATFIRSDGAPPLSQAIAPTWSAQHIFSVVDDSGAVRLSSTVPVLTWNETDGATDNKVWRMIANSEQFAFQTRTDASGAGTNIMTVDRTGTAVDDITLGADRLLLNSDASQALDLFFIDNQSATDEKRWRFRANGAGQMQYGAINDALSVGVNYMTVDRTATAIDQIAFNVGASGATGSLDLQPLSTGTVEANIKGRATGAANGAYLQFRDSIGTVMGYVGDGAVGNSDVYLASSNSNNIQLSFPGGQNIFGNSVLMTPLNGTFSVTDSGGGSCTVAYSSAGRVVELTIGTAGTCTSTSVSTGGPFSCTGCVPTAIRPTTQKLMPIRVLNNSVGGFGMIRINSSGDINSGCGADVGAGCTASGTKGISPASGTSYGLD